MSALRAHRKRQLEERVRKAGLWEEHGLVFPSEVGTPMSGCNLYRAFKIRIKRASLPQTLRLHDGALLNLIRAHALLHQASRDRDAQGRIVATIEEDYVAVRELVVDLVGEGVETTVPSTVRETVEAAKRLREDSNGEPVTVAELARKLELDRSAVSRRARNAKDRGFLRDLEENPRKPSRLIPGDDLPDDLQILPTPEAVRAGMQERASVSARPDRVQELQRNGQYSSDAYKACSRARVQEGIKTPLPPVACEPGDVDNPPDNIIEEVRDLFASDAVEEV